MRERPGPSVGPGLILRTILELPPGRVVRRVGRPLRGTRRRILRAIGAGPGPLAPAPVALAAGPPLPEAHWTPPASFRFVGLDRSFGDAVRWDGAPTRLWSYHLHALDALREDHPLPERTALLDAWSAANPFGSRPGWEPYPSSLRLVNAFEMLLASPSGALAARAPSLADQAWWLEANLETDLGANHLWKNAVALAWAGRALAGRSPDRWRRRADAMIATELSRQLLADGFHVERSPGYHAVFLDDLIRLETLLRAAGEGDGPLAGRLRAGRRAAAGALASVLHPDGEIPLFNDAALGQAPPTPWLLERSAALDEGARPPSDPLGAPAAGFHRLAGERSVVIFDAGEIGDAEQPGHAHADTLSFELSYDRTRVVVDAGVFDYEPGPRRSYARGTRGHGTVEIDGIDQSEMWGVFRVGRRARPLDVRRADEGGRVSIEAGHDGYRHLPGGPTHRRSMEHAGSDVWRVVDTVTGGGEHRAVSRVRLHPSFAVRATGEGTLEATDGAVVARLAAESPHRWSIEEGSYFPRFGVEERCAVACLAADGTLPLRLAYRLELSTRS
ncbi:MAG TPA: alginate lyase family protein [Candidatus Polarisedimenticolaceae bacterium]|nr:alginate lyase family protein [Candidatus Polarisedimenticolaceae bacterium]